MSEPDENAEFPGPYPPGTYWILHRPQDNIVEATDRYDWADGERVLSRFEIRPGRTAVLEAGERKYEFTASISPFFESSGETIQTSNGEPVEFQWNGLPSAWLPIDYLADDIDSALAGGRSRNAKLR